MKTKVTLDRSIFDLAIASAVFSQEFICNDGVEYSGNRAEAVVYFENQEDPDGDSVSSVLEIDISAGFYEVHCEELCNTEEVEEILNKKTSINQ